MTATDTAARGGQKWTCPPQGGQPNVETPSKTIKCSTSRRKTVLSTTRGGGHVHFCPPLADWLSTLRQRGITATVHDHTVHLDGPNITDTDLAWLTRHHDALTTAAAGTHPDWWAGVTTGNHTPDADLPDLDCAVHNCPGDLRHYSDDGIPFCADHNPDWWWTR